MATVQVINGKEARERLNRGVQTLVSAVASTLGANGSNAILVDNLAPPRVTKDGVTVAKSIRLHDFVENAGADIVKQASISAAETAKDGTTTSTVIAGAILNECVDIPETSKKFDVRVGMNKAVNRIIENLDKQAVKIDDNLEVLKRIATISANNTPEIGNLVAETIHKFKNNVALSKENREETSVSETIGYTYLKGLANEHMTQIDGDKYAKLDNPKLLIIDDNLTDFKRIAKVIDECCIKRKHNLVIMANMFGQEFLRVLLQNVYTKGSPISRDCISIVETPNYNDRRTDSIKDIVRCADATLFSIDEPNAKSLNEFTFEDLGELKLFETRDETTTLIFTEKGDEVAKSIVKDLKESIKKTEDLLVKDRLQERINRLSKGTATIYLSARTDAEHSELYDLYEDSLGACQSAIEEGVVDGGGLALLRASNEISTKDLKNEDERLGFNIILKACRKPFEQIVINSGVDFDSIYSEIKKSKYKKGYDAKENKVVDMKKAGIVDPKKVTRIALESALSASVTILTTNSVIFPYDFEK